MLTFMLEKSITLWIQIFDLLILYRNYLIDFFSFSVFFRDNSAKKEERVHPPATKFHIFNIYPKC